MDEGAGSGLLRFGVFELDARAGELRRSGRRVALQHQPFEILCALLERPGEVLTREELRARVWRNGAYVDFERGLNKAMVKLRDALGDDADSPRFVETLPRHGYRFIGEVGPLPAPQAHAPGIPQPVVPVSAAGARPPKAPRSVWPFAALALAILAVAALWVALRAPAADLRIVESVQLTHSASTKLTYPAAAFSMLHGDGKSLYFNEIAPSGAFTIMRLPLAGGEPQPLDFGIPNLMMYALAPDASELLAARIPPSEYQSSAHELWRLPLRGGAPVRLGAARVNWAGWSRDGQRVYYYDAFDRESRGRLSVMRRDGSGAHVVLSSDGDVQDAVESPDDTRLRYNSFLRLQHLQIWEAGRGGGAPHALLPEWSPTAEYCCGRWTPDGRRYIFQAGHVGHSDLWMLSEERRWFSATPVPVRLSSGPMSLTSPVPAPDGRTVYAFGEQAQGELVRYDMQRHEFVPYLGGISAEGLSFTRDGSLVVYSSYPQAELWRMRVDGTDRHQLTVAPMQALGPVWSPDGRRIAFMARESATRPFQIYVVSADGGDAQALTAESASQFFPDWTPDGSALVFSGHPFNPDGIRIIDLATRTTQVAPASQDLCCANWIPNDTRLLASSADRHHLVRYDPASGTRTDVYRGAFQYFASSRDGRYVYFDSGIGAHPAIYRVPIDGGPAEHVADLDEVRRTHGIFGLWMDLAPDDSPMMLRNTSSQQIYALTLGPR
jgi:Tol biopolymer transport system component/DNA-binding winged helix-turn-helix (wHTH) protein